MKNYFENNLARFAHILRHLGIRISTGETITALQALRQLDILNREHVKLALSATMVKNVDEQPIFNQAFDNFFAAPEVRERQRAEFASKQEEMLQLLEQAEQDLSYQGEQLELSEEEKLLYANLSEENKEKIKEFIRSSHGPADLNTKFRPMLESQIRGSLRYWKQRLGEEEGGEVLLRQQVDDEILASVLDDLDHFDESLLHEDMKRIGSGDIPRVTMMLKKLSHKLATKISRRYRSTQKAVKIDLRRSIKSNVRYGGIIFKLKYRQKRVQKPQLLLICDVSGSMARYAAFVIQFIYGLSAAVRNIESFIFSEELEYVTPFFSQMRPFEQTMSELMGESRIWGRGTNIGRSLNKLRERYGRLLTPQTVVIMMSDTKTLDLAAAVDQFVRVKRSVKDIIWLNTIPESEWRELPSVQSFKRHCLMYECYTLAHLERIIRKQFLP